MGNYRYQHGGWDMNGFIFACFKIAAGTTTKAPSPRLKCILCIRRVHAIFAICIDGNWDLCYFIIFCKYTHIYAYIFVFIFFIYTTGNGHSKKVVDFFMRVFISG